MIKFGLFLPMLLAVTVCYAGEYVYLIVFNSFHLFMNKKHVFQVSIVKTEAK